MLPGMGTRGEPRVNPLPIVTPPGHRVPTSPERGDALAPRV